MSKLLLPALVLAVGLSGSAVPMAHAYDSDIRSDWQDIHRDRAAIANDARRVDEERGELADARHQQRWSWLHGDFWGAHRAAEHAREEAGELHAAQHKLNRDVADIRRDRADLREDYGYRRHWWWY